MRVYDIIYVSAALYFQPDKIFKDKYPTITYILAGV